MSSVSVPSMNVSKRRDGVWSLLSAIACLVVGIASASAQTPSAPSATATGTTTIAIRGHQQTLHLYGTPGRPAAIVSSGDGGWMHLGPHVAETLAARGYFVVGFDAKAYLSSFTSGQTTLRPEDEPGDYRMLVDFAARGGSEKPILIGVSEGAGLSVMAATDPATRAAIAGVIGLGLPDMNELGWRWKDALIYVTHGAPREPSFSSASLAARVAPTPLAAIHSTQDEYVPLDEVQRVMAAAKDPKKLWIVKASNHRFGDNLPEFDRTLFEAIDWLRQHAAGR